MIQFGAKRMWLQVCPPRTMGSMGSSGSSPVGTYRLTKKIIYTSPYLFEYIYFQVCRENSGSFSGFFTEKEVQIPVYN